MRTSILTSALLVSALCGALPDLAQETIDTRIGTLTFESGHLARRGRCRTPPLH